ncbi:hypothetical protein [Janthinobacterium sp. OK676]|uniref:hypothetical protein n=1 Tax=Janthinobacterium sp. OK676 TaxID=1855295 RepID=UPI001113A489|nr:hypothetical protein [Janthinobacterium sp. OK676]
MDARVNAHRHKKTAPEGAVLVSWQRRSRFVAVVLPGLDSQKNFGGFTGQGGFIGRQRGSTVLSFPVQLPLVHKKTAPEGAVLVS